MAFAFRKMLSNIGYFKKSDEQCDSEPELILSDNGGKKRRHSSFSTPNSRDFNSSDPKFEIAEYDVSSRRYSTIKRHPSDKVRYFAAPSRQNSLSDTDLVTDLERTSTQRKHKHVQHKTKKLRLDIDKANNRHDDDERDISLNNSSTAQCSSNVGYTPKHLTLGVKRGDALWSSKAFDGKFTESESGTDTEIKTQLLDAMRESPSRAYRDRTDEIESDSETVKSENTHDSERTESQTEIRASFRMCKKVGEKDTESSDLNEDVCSKENISNKEEDLNCSRNTEYEQNEEERITLLLGYQMKLEKLERLLKTLLTELQFHIEISNVFTSKSCLKTLPGFDIANLPKILGDITNVKDIMTQKRNGPSGAMNIIVEKEDSLAKQKLKRQLCSIKNLIDKFSNLHLTKPSRDEPDSATVDVNAKLQKALSVFNKNSTFLETIWKNCNVTNRKFDEEEEMNSYNAIMNRNELTIPPSACKRRLKVNKKKRTNKLYNFPDLGEVFRNLFALKDETDHSLRQTSISDRSRRNLTSTTSEAFISNASHSSPMDSSHNVSESFGKFKKPSTSISTDSGYRVKQSPMMEKSVCVSNDTIASSSLAEFSINNSVATAYSESMDNILSYVSYNETFPINNFLLKPAIDRIIFYNKVHRIEMKNVHENSLDNHLDNDKSHDSVSSTKKNSLVFTCSQCSNKSFSVEQSLLKHILSQSHNEKLHFFYKIKYIRHCKDNRSEIKPSTILNPMTMYRDDNKIVCFGDSKFACSLCFENSIVGESQLISHIAKKEHLEKRERLDDVINSEV